VTRSNQRGGFSRRARGFSPFQMPGLHFPSIAVPGLLLLTGCGNETAPAPLENKILLAAAQGPDISQIDVMGEDGSGAVRLTSGPGLRGGPVVSPSGLLIAFARRDQAFDSHIFVMESDGSGVRQLTTGAAADEEPSWSPDGTQIVFERTGQSAPSDLYVINVDGSNLRQLTNTNQRFEDSPAWSPDGLKIAVAIYDFAVGDREIHVMNAGGGGDVRRTTLPGEDLGPAWSPDGTELLFSHEVEPNGFRHIYRMKEDGIGLTPVTAGEVRDTDPAWAPDGRRIVFGRSLALTQTSYSQVYTLDLNSGVLAQLTSAAFGAYTPSWTGLQ
jgi:Tol biopolymer transport system component